MSDTGRRCPFAAALGVPGRGVHFHVFGIAIVDVALTIAAAVAVARWRGWSVAWCLVGAACAGIVAHRAACVRTTVDRWLFP